MGDFFYMRLYTKEYLSDPKVRALPRENRADLVDLWCYCDQEGSIPSDPAAVGRLLGISLVAAKKTLNVLKAFFKEEGGTLYSPRQRREHEARERETEKKRAGAEKTNGKRWPKPSLSDSLSDTPSDEQANLKRDAERIAQVSPVSSQQSVRTSSLREEASTHPPDRDEGEAEERALAIWREIAEPVGLPKVLKLDAKRRGHLKARLKEGGWLDLFREAITYAATHPDGAWMRGEGSRPWKADLDYFLRTDTVLKTVEKARAAGSGKPRASPSANGTPRRCATADAALDIQLAGMTFQELPSITVGAP